MKIYRLLLIVLGITACLGFTCGASQAETANKSIVLKLGGSELKNASEIWPELKDPKLKRLSAIDTSIVDVQIVSPESFYVFGKSFGSTSLIVWEKDQPEPVKVDVIVFLNVTALKQKLSELYPNQEIDVYASETGVVLSGTVTGPEIIEQVVRLTQTFLPKTAEGKGKSGQQQGTGRSGIGITNLLTVGALQQVMLEVKFAEVDRNSGRDWQAALGLVNHGNWAVGAGVNPLSGKFIKGFGAATTDFPGGVPQYDIGNLGQNGGGVPNWNGNTPGSILLNFAGNVANIFVSKGNWTAALNFLETENLARTLAEPRLVTMSGQEASFLAGGEFPFQTRGQNGETSVEFKEFGVGLKFTPVVMSDGKISLRVAPAVSDIVQLIETSTGPQPVFDTRQLESTVQLYDGQTLALAGLLKDSMVNVVTKIPGLGDIPVLGALFRSNSYQHQKTDLLISVTPHIVKPVKEGTLSYPGEFMQVPNRFEFYLEGRLEGRRDANDVSAMSQHDFAVTKESTSTQGGLEGQVGTEPVQAQ